MGVPNVVYKWKSLRTLHVTVFVMNVAGCFIVVIMIVSAVKLRMGIGQYLDLVVPGDGNFLPGMMFLIAFMCAPIYAIGIKICFHLRFFSPDTVPRLNQVLFIHCLLSFASMIVVVAINAMGILHLVNFHLRNHNGIIESMQEYATEIVAKVQVDMIQINFKCCGSKSFKDWFHVRWMQREGEMQEVKEHNESSFVSTDVPFSCCSTEMLQPCIHHNVLKPSEVYLYQPEHRLTIATTGCQAKVLSHARYVGGMLIFGMILLAAYQMVLALLSRLLQTAHSNSLYIGPRKDRYVSWILGSAPNPETYDDLVYEGRDAPILEEMVPLRETFEDDSGLQQMGEIESGGKSRCSDIEEEKKPPGERCSRILDARRSSSGTVTRQELKRKSSSSVKLRKGTSSCSIRTNSIPTPPPSPGTGDESIPEEDTRKPKLVRLGSERSVEGREERMNTMNNRRTLSRGTLRPRTNGNQIEELRESLECLKKYQSPWRGGSPIFETMNPSDLLHRSSRVDIRPQRGKNSTGSQVEGFISCPGSSSSSSSSSEHKRYRVCGKDSTEENETRMKKFCKDLSTEYKMSPYSKQRKDFSEQYKAHQPRLPDTIDEGRMIRNKVFARFNPADTYSRFRGSDQDTAMRRASQTLSGPPPILIPDQRTIPPHGHHRPPQQYPEDSQFLGHTLPCNHVAKAQVQFGGPSWAAHQNLSWGHRRPPVPTYFPISSRPPRPPRLPPSPYGPGHPNYQSVADQSHLVRQFQFVQNAEIIAPSSRRCQGRCGARMQPPRFSGR